jgi:hypothetical protein
MNTNDVEKNLSSFKSYINWYTNRRMIHKGAYTHIFMDRNIKVYFYLCVYIYIPSSKNWSNSDLCDEQYRTALWHNISVFRYKSVFLGGSVVRISVFLCCSWYLSNSHFLFKMVIWSFKCDCSNGRSCLSSSDNRSFPSPLNTPQL